MSWLPSSDFPPCSLPLKSRGISEWLNSVTCSYSAWEKSIWRAVGGGSVILFILTHSYLFFLFDMFDFVKTLLRFAFRRISYAALSFVDFQWCIVAIPECYLHILMKSTSLHSITYIHNTYPSERRPPWYYSNLQMRHTSFLSSCCTASSVLPQLLLVLTSLLVSSLLLNHLLSLRGDSHRR